VRPAEKNRLRHELHSGAETPDDREVWFDVEWTRSFEDHGGDPDVGLMLGGDTDGSADDLNFIWPQVEAGREAAMAMFARYDDSVGRARSLTRRRPHGRSLPSWWWDEVADIWLGFVACEIHDPTATFAREAEVPVATVSRWITVCRAAGKLDELPPWERYPELDAQVAEAKDRQQRDNERREP
jgi:hypothetical protein